LRAFEGMALPAARHWPQALAAFARAEELDPHNALAKYHAAAVLVQQERLHEAKQRLQLLHELVPREANAHLLLGRVLKKLGDKDGALQRFVTALELDPKGRTAAVKAATENVHSHADGEDGEASDLEF
jgi:Flp pilus assembly protein TadD